MKRSKLTILAFEITGFGTMIYALFLPPDHVIGTVIDGTGVHTNASAAVLNSLTVPFILIGFIMALFPWAWMAMANNLTLERKQD